MGIPSQQRVVEIVDALNETANLLIEALKSTNVGLDHIGPHVLNETL